MDKEDEMMIYSTTTVTKKDESSHLDVKTAADAKNSQPKIVRGTKKIRIDSTDCNNQQTTEKKDNSKDDEGDTKIVRSLKRSCELWSLEDKNTFFKAVNEYGKDFDALQSYFLSQGKKKGLPDNMIKNKEQIRHFYYRTWLKISKHLKFSEDVKKTSQELYGLINYGELRRKLPRIHEKFLLKLNELIYWGSSQVRLRGKTMRIKTPICRALRKLNQLEDWQEEIKLPSRVTVELRPGNNLTWWKVQANAMNPRVRTLVPIQRRLSSLLIFLSQRWKPSKFKQPLATTITVTKTTTSKTVPVATTTTTTNIDIAKIDEKKNHNELLRVAPIEGAKISLPVVNLGEYLTSNSVSLNSYEKRLGLKSSHTELLGYVQQFKSVGKKTIKKKTDKKLTIIKGGGSGGINDDVDKKDDNNSDLDNLDTHLNCLDKPLFTYHNNVVDKSLNDINNSNGVGGNGTTTTTNDNNNKPNCFPGRETVDRIRIGWNVDEANTITIGDLFLMFGRESKIILEYWWDSGTKENDDCTHVQDNQLKNLKKQEQENLSIALQKLLSIAKHNYGSSSKAYDNTLSSNETVISSRMPSIRESTFRRPLIPQVIHKMGGSHDAFKTQLDKFTTRFCKRGRIVRPRNLIVQRTIPIIGNFNRNDVNDIIGSNKKITDKNSENERHISKNKNDSKLLSKDDEEEKFLSSIGTDNSIEQQPSNSIITSATQILKEGEGQWLNSEVADYSLSSFLGQFESPIKGSQRSQTGDGVQIETPIRSSSDVVNQMQCLMVENSVDYMAKFANLASQIVSDEEHK